MKLSKTDALFLHKVLYHFAESQKGFSDLDAVEDFTHRLADFLLSGSDDAQTEDDEYDDEEVEDREEEEESDGPEADDRLMIKAVADLPAIRVTTPDGSKMSLEFDDVGDENTVDVLFDQGSVILDRVSHVRRHADSIEFYDGEEWHSYNCRKFSKMWTNTFEVDVLYELESE